MNDTIEQKPRAKRRWLSFSIRGLLIFTLLIAVGVVLPIKWREHDLAQYRVEEDVDSKIDLANGWTFRPRLRKADPITWKEYPSHLWKRTMNWGHDEDLYQDIESVHMPLEELVRLGPELQKLRSLKSIHLFMENSDDHGAPILEEELELLASLKTLEIIDLSGVAISPAQLRKLTVLPNVTCINFPMSRSSLPYLEVLSDFRKLETISLHDVPITRQAIETLAGFEQLRSLSIYYWIQKETTEEVEAIGELKQLTSLYVCNYSYNDQWFQTAGNLTSLRSLHLSFHSETDRAPGENFHQLSNLTQLENLTIDGVQIDDDALATIGKLSGLKVLACDASRTTDAGMKHLANLPQLTKANLSGTRISIHGLHTLSQSSTLDEVYLGGRFQVFLRNHRQVFCGTCALPFDYADNSQFDKDNATPSAILATHTIYSEDPFVSPEALTDLPDNFADTINDPFQPFSEASDKP